MHKRSNRILDDKMRLQYNFGFHSVERVLHADALISPNVFPLVEVVITKADRSSRFAAFNTIAGSIATNSSMNVHQCVTHAGRPTSDMA